jgi:hypothetical protein
MGIKVANNANATLAASINSAATSITVTSGQGARFPTLSAGDYFYATLIDVSNNLEIVKVTARSTDVLTVTRAQESTTARAYSTGDRIELRLTAQTFVDGVALQDTGVTAATYGSSTNIPVLAINAKGQVTSASETAVSGVPIGAVEFFAMSTAPTGWLKANGAAVSRTTYASLFAAISTTFGVGDGSTTFNVPDLRGEFIRGFSDGRSVDSGRSFGTFQKGSVYGIDGPGGSDVTSVYANSGAFSDIGVEQTNATEYPNALAIYTGGSSPSARFGIDAGVGVSRPRNIALLSCIKF